MPSAPALTPRMIAAAEAYIRGSSWKQAMLKAGYNEGYCEAPRNVMKFLKSRALIEYVRKRQQKRAEAADLDAQEIIKACRHIIADDNPRDRVAAAQLLHRIVEPLDPDKVTRDDINKSIVINFGEAKKE